MEIREVRAKSILSPSKIYPYVLNPYVGCQHGCSYCYAGLAKGVQGRPEPWGTFVDAKINGPELLAQEIRRKPKDRVWLSGLCDPYQPLEGRYGLTRRCLQTLIREGWPLTVLTRSGLVLRDRDLLGAATGAEVGFSIPTADDGVRRWFEPSAPPIPERIRALGELHGAGIRTYVMIAPLLPGAEGLMDLLVGSVDQVLVDRMNYRAADSLYARHGLEAYRSGEYLSRAGGAIRDECRRWGIPCRILFR